MTSVICCIEKYESPLHVKCVKYYNYAQQKYMYAMHICVSATFVPKSEVLHSKSRIVHKSCNYWLLRLKANVPLYICHKYTCSKLLLV